MDELRMMAMKKIMINFDANRRCLNMRLLILSVLLSIFVVSGHVSAADPASSLVYVGYKSNQGEPVELQLNFQGEIPSPSYFTSESPARITFDFPGVKNQLPWTLPLQIKGGGNAQSITAVEASGRTRVVVNLSELVEYETRIEAGSLFVSLKEKGAKASSSAQEERVVQVEEQPESVVVIEEQDSVVVMDEYPESVVVMDEGQKQNDRRSLQSIKYQALSGDRLEIRLKFDDEAPQPNAFSIDNPSRLVFDLAQVSSELSRNSIHVGVGAAKSVTAIEAGGRTRVVVNLISAVNYEAVAQGNELKITLENPAAERTSMANAGDYGIESIDFRRGEDGQGRVVVALSDPNIVVDTRLVGSKVIVDFLNTQLPSELAQRYDVLDFATPVQFVEAQMNNSGTRLVVTMKEGFEHLAFQADKHFTLDVKVPQKAAKVGRKDGEYIGDKLSLNFQDIEVRAVLQLIADFTGLNMVASDTVEGNLTLRLKNVPWDQALEIILRTKGLAMRQEGNVILVAPSDEVAAREKLELESQQQLADLEPIRTELVQINYAKATELIELLTDGEGLLSARGKVSVDERTNTLLVTDIAEKRENIRNLLSKLDIAIRQVMIDSRVVIATSDFSHDLGARFGVTGVDQQGDNLLMTSGSSRATGSVMMGSALDDATSRVEVPTGLTSYTDRLNVNMPVTAPSAGRFALSILSGGSLLDLELSALQSEGRGELISSPRVVTSNGKEALIEQGTEIPYLQASSSGAATVAFKKAVLSLTVTPQITPDDRVLMDLRVSKDAVGEIFSNVPSIDTKEVNTQVLVSNGDTVVLGGVYEQIKRDEVDKVPLLGDLPILGALFRNTSKEDDKIELLIFVTPKILKEGGRLH